MYVALEGVNAGVSRILTMNEHTRPTQIGRRLAVVVIIQWMLIASIAAKLTTDKDVDFRAISADKIIIDKTRFIPNLLNYFGNNPHLFMLRPYRFGKSFFLSTLAAFFEGKKNLFCNRLGKQMDICNYTSWNWDEYPILYMDFGLATSYSLLEYVKEEVIDMAKKYNIFDINEKDTFDSVMKCAFERIQRKTGKKTVILVDEYDLPVAKVYFDDVAQSMWKESEIEVFFHAVKVNAPDIEFAFVFGATKTTTVGGINDLFEDITHEETFSALIGFTEEEIKEYYKNQLEETAHERKLTNGDDVLQKIMKPYYNHYRFTRNGVRVFNPLSVTSFLREKPDEPKSFWGETIPDRGLLKNVIDKFPKEALDMIFEKAITISDKKLKQELDRKTIRAGSRKELAKILFQTGFMSIGETCTSDKKFPSCTLGVVNREAKQILVDSLRDRMEENQVEKMETLLQNYKLPEFMEELDNAIGQITGDKYFVLETKYQHAIAFILELTAYTVKGFGDAFQKRLLVKTEYEIGTKFMNYKKELPGMTVMFYLKEQDQGQEYVDMKAETMRCLGTYAKPYGKDHKDEKVLYIIISFYEVTKEGETLENKFKRNPSGLRFIHNWAAFEWFQETETIKTYNLRLDGSDDRTKRRVEIIARYSETDQEKNPRYLVPLSFDRIADQIIEEYPEVISLEKYYDFIELFNASATDFPQYVSKYTPKIEMLLELTEKCHKKVSRTNEPTLYNRLNKIIEALKTIKPKGT